MYDCAKGFLLYYKRHMLTETVAQFANGYTE